MVQKPSAFISYSHSDRPFVMDLTKNLTQQGIQVWMDEFEIQPGDSLIEKVFNEGLSKSQFFIVVLSKESVKSKWQKEELATAMSLKIDGLIHIIPVLKEECEIPVAIRGLMYVDLSKSYDDGVKRLVKTMYGVVEKPPIGSIPDHVSTLNHSVGGLSKEASTIGSLLVSHTDDGRGYEPRLWSRAIPESLPELSPDAINDAVEELESYGLVKADRVMGNAPYHFADVTATYALYLHFKDEGLSYDPEEDIKAVAAVVEEKKEVTGKDIQDSLDIPPGRINRAVSYLDDYGYVRVVRTMGTAPYSFRDVMSTWRTRQFVEQNSFA